MHLKLAAPDMLKKQVHSYAWILAPTSKKHLHQRL